MNTCSLLTVLHVIANHTYGKILVIETIDKNKLINLSIKEPIWQNQAIEATEQSAKTNKPKKASKGNYKTNYNIRHPNTTPRQTQIISNWTHRSASWFMICVKKYYQNVLHNRHASRLNKKSKSTEISKGTESLLEYIVQLPNHSNYKNNAVRPSSVSW